MKPRITVTSAFDPPAIRLGVVRGISYGLFGKPGEFVPQARAIGAELIRAYLYWPAATVTDAFGQAETVHGRDGQLRLPVSVTPIFVTEQPPAGAS